MDKKTNGAHVTEAPLKNDFSEWDLSPGLDPFSGDLLWSPPVPRRGGWSVSWSDLMMTMFVFFVILYVYQSGSRELQFGPGPGQNTVSDSGSGKLVEMNLNSRPSEIFNQTRQAILNEFVTGANVDLVEDRAVRISLAGDLFFDLGRADLKPEARWRLNQIGKILRENLFVVNVVGHTDSMPNHSDRYPTNWELSTARACRVARYLIQEAGVPEERFFVSGHAWLQPLMPNTTAYNRSLNRRVEIILMKERPFAETNSSLGLPSKSRTVNNG
ncbi:flagellar motor protein MotB [Desulfobacula sp.]|uniref:OmpA/MotB family protein n=1 Tax=Desulfobacula sp. TaxID=2593537 RepID=UPI00262091A0|nr:flagellar motor protein MotB [Desulfobacula sp.]